AWSSGSFGSQLLPFFPHEGPGLVGLHRLGRDMADHRVVGGLGMAAGSGSGARGGVEADGAEAAGGPPALALGEMAGDLEGLVLRQVAAEQGGAGALGEVSAAGGAAQAAAVAGFAGPAVRTDVGAGPLAEGGAVRVGAGEDRPVALFHGALLGTSDTL